MSPNLKEKYLDVLFNKDKFNNNDLIELGNIIKYIALANNVTYYAHIFFPLSNIPSYKITSFYKIENDSLLLSFDYNDLIRTEIDASSITYNNDLSKTKGYLYWDYYSNIYIKDNIMFIPSFFIDELGNTLDVKYPLRKSTILIKDISLKLYKLLNINNVKRITPLVGLEIEYYLYSKDNNLINYSPSSNYLNSISEEILKFMKDVNDELLSLNIVAKIMHKEVSINQYELVLFYNDCNRTFEYNYLIMDALKKTAKRYNLVCDLREKPFQNLNGSGKHNNYSLMSDNKINFFNKDNRNLFLITFVSLLHAIKNNQSLILLGTYSKSNDKRLNSNEAPSNIISINVSEDIINYFEKDIEFKDNNVSFELYNNQTLIKEENNKRNRTSPIGLFNNKVEFRGLGSSMSDGLLNTIINTILASSLNETMNRIKNELTSLSISKAIKKITKEIYFENKNIIYNDSCYEEKYIEYAKENNLLNIKDSISLFNYVKENKTYKILIENNIFNEMEINKIIDFLHKNKD